jgi:hypothetical protein
MEDKKIVSRLDAITILILSILKENKTLPPLPSLFYQLKKVGISNEEIANIFDKKPDQVAKTAYEYKRPAKEKGTKKIT